jgi:tRNA threonylcarbamoyladenosine biosynthesis protein TsaB
VNSRILAIDTTSAFGSLALLEQGETLEEVILYSPDGFAHVLFDQIGRLLTRHDWTLSSVDCFAALSGPGSFTGVRIGLAAVKGLAEANSKRAVAISNLQALASFGTRPLRAVVQDARRGEVYAALYNASLALLGKEQVLRFSKWLESLPENNLEFISPDFAPFRTAIAGTRFEQTPVVETPRALAAAAGRIANRLLATGQTLDPAALDANYVRRSDAELFWRDDHP